MNVWNFFLFFCEKNVFKYRQMQNVLYFELKKWRVLFILNDEFMDFKVR